MSSPRLLDGPIIRELLAEVAAALPSSSTQHIVIVAGGSLLAWMGLRDATEDVDSIQRLDAELRDAVASIATRHGLDTDWLNDRAAPFMPATFDVGRCTVLLEQPRLLALGASLRDVFLMKLYRTQPNDVADMRTIWPHIASEFRTGPRSHLRASQRSPTRPTTSSSPRSSARTSPERLATRYPS
jgi:hypothetical protein